MLRADAAAWERAQTLTKEATATGMRVFDSLVMLTRSKSDEDCAGADGERRPGKRRPSRPLPNS